MPEVTVIDYGIGNILNVKRGFEQCGADVVLVNQPEAVIDAFVPPVQVLLTASLV